MTTQLLTPIGQSYWNKQGAYQEIFDKFTEEMMPSEGMASTLHGELIRACNRLRYEYYNNGNCNACEMGEPDYVECYSCHGSGTLSHDEDYDCDDCDGQGEIEEDGDCEVSEMYSNFLDLIRESVNTQEISNLCSRIRIFIEGNHYGNRSRNNDKDINLYDELIDRVTFFVLTTEDKPLPKNYDN